MFDTMNIAKKIKQARIEKNMTQMNLADAMGVSYQAVSNWERGNSLPDISKLGDLCAALDITVNDLLGIEAPTVTKAMEQEELTMEELVEVAPMLPPQTVMEQMEGKRKEMEQRLQEGLEGMSQLLADTFQAAEPLMKEAAERAAEKEKKSKLDLSRIADLAPYLDQEYLDKLIEDADPDDLDGLEDLAPYLSKESIDKLVERAPIDDADELAESAPFMSKETLEKLVSRCVAVNDFSTLEELAPFVSKETLDRLAENVTPENIWEVVSIAPFFSQDALDKLVRRCEDVEEFDALEELAPFVSKTVMDGMVDRYIEKGSDADLTDIYPFLSKESLRKLADYMMQQKDLDALEDLVEYL